MLTNSNMVSADVGSWTILRVTWRSELVLKRNSGGLTRVAKGCIFATVYDNKKRKIL